jgi:hypothetical protein
MVSEPLVTPQSWAYKCKALLRRGAVENAAVENTAVENAAAEVAAAEVVAAVESVGVAAGAAVLGAAVGTVVVDKQYQHRLDHSLPFLLPDKKWRMTQSTAKGMMWSKALGKSY